MVIVDISLLSTHSMSALVLCRPGRKNIILNRFSPPNDHVYKYTSTHAEYALISRHEKNCPAIKHILVLRVHPKQLKLGMSRPCNICQQLLLDYGVETVTYSSYSGSLITETIEELTSSDSE